MSTVKNVCDDLGVTAGKENGTDAKGTRGCRGKRAGKKVQAAKQVRESMSSTTVKKAQTAKYIAKNFSTTKETGILLRTLAKECTGHQSFRGTLTSQNENTTSRDKHSHSSNTHTTADEQQNLVNVSKGASRQPNGKPYRGTRAGKHVKMRNNCKKVAMLFNALSSECSKN